MQNEPVIICSNHNNQFMDGLLLASHLNREIKFIVAAKSMRRPIIGQFSRALGGIPVERAQDLAYQGKGVILKIGSTYIEQEIKDEYKFKNKQGHQTQFIKQCEVGSTLTISSIEDEFLVTEIVSNERLNIQRKDRYEDLVEIKKPYKIIPKLDQTQMYDAVWQALNNNQCIGIFPEGGSHDRTDLLPLKAGVCIMALGAMQKYKKQVKIVPCGLNYFSGHKFRSKVVIEFGQAYEIPQEFVDIYSKSRREAISKLLIEIKNRLRDVTIPVPTYRELNSIFMARRIYLPADREYTPKEELQLNRRFAQGYIKKIEDPRVKEMLEKIRQYSSQLKNLGTQDYEIKKYNSTLKIDYKSLAGLIIKTLFSMGFSFPAIILNTPIAIILRYLSERERVKCQKSSKVKVLGKDVVASYQVLCAFVILPIANTLYTFIFRYLLKNKCKYFKNRSLKFITALFFILYPIYTFIMVNAADQISLNIRAIKAKFLFVTRQEQLKKLRNYREQLYIEIRDFIKEQSRSELKSSGNLLSQTDLHSSHQEIQIGSKSNQLDQVDGFFDVLEEIGC